MKKAAKKTSDNCVNTNYILRLALGGLLTVGALQKFKVGIEVFVENFANLFQNTVIPYDTAVIILTADPFVELALGLLILLGLFTRQASMITAYWFTFFIIGLSAIGNPITYTSIANNFIYIAAAILLANNPCSWLSLDYALRKKR